MLVSLALGFNAFTPLNNFDLDGIKSSILKAYCVISGQLKVYDSSLSTNFALTQIPANTPSIIIAKNQVDNLDGNVGEVVGGGGLKNIGFYSSMNNSLQEFPNFLSDVLLNNEGNHDISSGSITLDSVVFTKDQYNQLIVTDGDISLTLEGNLEISVQTSSGGTEHNLSLNTSTSELVIASNGY